MGFTLWLSDTLEQGKKEFVAIFPRNGLQFILQNDNSCMAKKCDDFVTDKINGQKAIISDTDHICQNLQKKKNERLDWFIWAVWIWHSKVRVLSLLQFLHTADESSDEEYPIDWKAPIYEKPY